MRQKSDWRVTRTPQPIFRNNSFSKLIKFSQLHSQEDKLSTVRRQKQLSHSDVAVLNKVSDQRTTAQFRGTLPRTTVQSNSILWARSVNVRLEKPSQNDSEVGLPLLSINAPLSRWTERTVDEALANTLRGNGIREENGINLMKSDRVLRE